MKTQLYEKSTASRIPRPHILMVDILRPIVVDDTIDENEIYEGVHAWWEAKKAEVRGHGFKRADTEMNGVRRWAKGGKPASCDGCRGLLLYWYRQPDGERSWHSLSPGGRNARLRAMSLGRAFAAGPCRSAGLAVRGNKREDGKPMSDPDGRRGTR